jgi:predicted amidohydrolase YtcJ
MFFIGHCQLAGDTHIINLGKRAFRLDPMATALKLGLPVSIHQDCPVTKPDMLHSVWCAVDRLTPKGVVLGEEEKVDVYDALIAATHGGAYSYFEEDTKGILKAGALADLVVLDRDPTAVPSLEIKDIKVLATYLGGKAVYESK